MSKYTLEVHLGCLDFFDFFGSSADILSSLLQPWPQHPRSEDGDKFSILKLNNAHLIDLTMPCIITINSMEVSRRLRHGP